MTAELAARSANFGESRWVNVHWSVWRLDHCDDPRMALWLAPWANGWKR